jgi:hypothetical protein
MASKIKEVKPKINKCKYCAGIIFDSDLGIYPQLDMKRNFKYKKNTKGELKKDVNGDLILVEFKAHKQCHEKKEAERIAWTNLYEYVREEYFEKIVPTPITIRMQDLFNGTNRLGGIINSKEGYKYDTIYHCFVESENDIKKAISSKVFHSEGQKGNYIMAIVESRIGNFEDYKAVAAEKDKQNELSIDFSKVFASTELKQETKEDYDILDDL